MVIVNIAHFFLGILCFFLFSLSFIKKNKYPSQKWITTYIFFLLGIFFWLLNIVNNWQSQYFLYNLIIVILFVNLNINYILLEKFELSKLNNEDDIKDKKRKIKKLIVELFIGIIIFILNFHYKFNIY